MPLSMRRVDVMNELPDPHDVLRDIGDEGADGEEGQQGGWGFAVWEGSPVFSVIHG